MLGRDTLVALGEERLDDLHEGARAWVQDRDPGASPSRKSRTTAANNGEVARL
jgi:hypothetical protein